MSDPNSNPNELTNQTFSPGTVIDGKYVIKSVLGVGGFATVYKANQTSIDREVAIKVMNSSEEKSASPEQFFQEAKIAAKITHPNVVSIYDFGFIAQTKQPYIVMEVVYGHDLGVELANNGPLAPVRVYKLFKGVLEALAEGHNLGIIHKDLKPSNLHLTDPGGPRETLKILDFGIAKLDEDPVAPQNDKDAVLLGTPRYLAPEYINEHIVTPGIDVYQIALIISESLCGKPAAAGNPYMALMNNSNGKLDICPFLTQGRVGEVFSLAFCKDPTMRFQDAQEFVDAFEAVEDEFRIYYPICDREGNLIPPPAMPQNAPPAISPTLSGQRQGVGYPNNIGSMPTPASVPAAMPYSQGMGQYPPQNNYPPANSQVPSGQAPLIAPPNTLPVYDPKAVVYAGDQAFSAPTMLAISAPDFMKGIQNKDGRLLPKAKIMIVCIVGVTVIIILILVLTAVLQKPEHEPEPVAIHEEDNHDTSVHVKTVPEIVDDSDDVKLDKPEESNDVPDDEKKAESDEPLAIAEDNAPDEPVDEGIYFKFESVPAGATVYDIENDAEICKATPCELNLPTFKDKKKVEFRLKGHKTQKVSLDPEGDPTVSVRLSSEAGSSSSSSSSGRGGNRRGGKRRPI